jgi:hypothetical protein
LKDLTIRRKIVVDLTDDVRVVSDVGEPAPFREEDFPTIDHTLPNVEEYSPTHYFEI